MEEQPKAGLIADWRRRLVSNRFPLLAALAAFAVLWISGRIGLSLFALLSLLMLAVSMLAPVRTAAARRASRSNNNRSQNDLARLGPALEGIPDPVLVIDQRGVIHYANREYHKVLGTMQPGASVLIRFRSPEVLDMIQRAITGESPKPVELVERSPREHWFMVSIAPLPRNDHTPVGYVMHFRDLSELRRAERMRTDFIANASHELRTPLASLTGFIETLSGAARDDKMARERFLEIMHDQAERMSRLIDDLLSLSRFETALGRSDFTRVDLVDVLVHVVGALQPMAERSDIEIALDHSAVEGTIAVVHGNRDELIQLFENLVENAIKYGAAGKRVDINVTPGELGGLAALVVEVRDYGAGIAEEHIPRLTERFYRIDVEASRDKQGTGLGLAIVKHIVTRHEGRLNIQSRLGEGTRLRVTIPAMISDNPAVESENIAFSDI